MTKQVSQKTQIEKLLRRGRLVTAEQAKALGITKPSARIRELRIDGLNIQSTTNRQGTPAWKMPKVAKAVAVDTAPRAFGFSY